MNVMANINTQHKTDLAHHLRQGTAWLAASANGEHTAALSYSAFELRFAVERLAVHHWAILLDRPIEENDMRDIEKFSRVQNRVYELAGHQKEIDGHFAFMRIVLDAMKIDIPLITPKIGELARCWHECSELCHIAWPLSCSATEVRKAAFLRLTEIAQSLATQVSSLGWPALRDAAFQALRNDFITGKASADDVLSYIRERGIWARAEFPDGRPSQFIGEAVPPEPKQ